MRLALQQGVGYGSTVSFQLSLESFHGLRAFVAKLLSREDTIVAGVKSNPLYLISLWGIASDCLHLIVCTCR